MKPRRQDCVKFSSSDDEPCSDPVNRGRQGLAYWSNKSTLLGRIDVGAIRISAHGWEGWMVNALKVSFVYQGRQTCSSCTLALEL
jgi:hypothetical protein